MFFPDHGKTVLRRVRRLVELGQVDKALAMASRYRRRRPSDPLAWMILGETLHNTGLGDGRSVLEEGLRLHPTSLVIVADLFGLLMGTSEADEAERVITPFIAAHPSSPLPFVLMGELAHRRGDYSQAKAMANQAWERLPTGDRRFDNHVRLQLGHLAVLLGDPDWRVRGRALLERGLKRPSSGNIAHAHLILAVLDELTDPQSAKEHFARARAAWFNRGGSPEEVMELYRDAIQGGAH